MKKILIINCSFRKRNTYGVLKKINDKLEALSFNCEVINLKDYNIEFCKGCEYCISKGDCFIEDNLKVLLNKMKEAEGIIIGTPVYVNNMSGILKNFLDRTCKWFHRSEVV
jgi:multimeric flavodoxin WrbA